LVTNALHHTVSNGKIVLGLRKVDNSLEVRVSDNGVGIPEEYKDKIFEKFVQVQRKQARLRTGVGLGLTFCKMAVESHGGNIKVESESNQGSAFVFTLPFKKEA
jgi:signal transduction histidine kinase